MKWVGQHIYDLVSRFRNDVYLESISSGTIASGGNLGLDSNNKIVKAAEATGDITGVALTAGTGVDLTSVSGATGGAYAATIGVDVSDFMSSGSASRVLTSTGADAMQGETYLTFANTDNISTLSLLSNQDTGDLFKIDTTTHGATTLTTIDDNATAAHLTFYPDGDLKNQAKSGLNYWYKSTNTDDYLKLEIGTNGEATFTTVDAAAAAADITFTPDGDFLVNSDSIKFISDQANDPLVQIRNEANDDTGPRLKFNKIRGADGQDSDSCGIIQFASYDDGTPSTQTYGQIETKIADAASGQEAGDMFFQVPSYDGVLTQGLKLAGDTNADGEVDVTIASGAASTTTIAGTLTKGFNVALTNAGLVSVAAQTNITSVGTLTGLTTSGAIELGHASDTTLARSASGVITVEGKEVRTADRQIQAVYTSFQADDIDTKHYLAFNDGDSENTSAAHVDMPIVAPFAGKLLSVSIRQSRNTSSHVYTLRLETQAAGVTFGTGPTIVGTQSGNSPSNTSIVTYDFTSSLDSGDNIIDAGDVVHISIQSNSSPGGSTKYYFTCLFEWDYSSI